MCATLALVGGLWLQMASGNDPALAPDVGDRNAAVVGGAAPAAGSPPPSSIAQSPDLAPPATPAPAPVQTATS
jgi:hypothetical protein